MLRCLGERINLLRFSITYLPFCSSTISAHLINNHPHVSHLHMNVGTDVDDSFATKRDELVDKVLVVSLPWRVGVDGQRSLLLGKFGRDRKDVGDIASTERSSYLRITVKTYVMNSTDVLEDRVTRDSVGSVRCHGLPLLGHTILSILYSHP